VAREQRRNPFHYGTPAEGDYFTGRREELSALLSRITNGVNVVLLSPRRYGKTSLIRAAERTLSRKRPPAAVIDVNVLRAASLPSLAGLLTAGAFRIAGGRWHRGRQAVPEFLRRLRVRPVVSFDEAGVPRFGFDASLAGKEADVILADIYALLADEAERRPAALVLDEFQAIPRLGKHLPDLLKALADEHPEVSLVLSGSKRHLMEDLVIRQRAPLFGMAQRLSLGPIPEEEMSRFLAERAEAGGKPIRGSAADRILQLAGPVPNDIQHLAFEAFEVAKDRLDVPAVEAGMAQAVSHDSTLFAENLARLSPGQVRVLVAVASGPPDHPYSSAFARSVDLANASSVRKAFEPLLVNEDVVERDGRLVISDPFFAEWLRSSDSDL
jgi:hypothetical protein